MSLQTTNLSLSSQLLDQDSVNALARMQQLSLNNKKENVWQGLPWVLTKHVASFLDFRDITALQRSERLLRNLITTHLQQVTLSAREIQQLTHRLLETPNNAYLLTIASKVTNLIVGNTDFTRYDETQLSIRLPFFTMLKTLDCSGALTGAFLPALPRSIKTLSIECSTDTLQAVIQAHPSIDLCLYGKTSQSLIGEMLAALENKDNLAPLQEVAKQVTDLDLHLQEWTEDQFTKVLPYFVRLQKLHLGSISITESCLQGISSSIQFVNFHGVFSLNFKTLLQFSDLHPQCTLTLPNSLIVTTLKAWLRESLKETAQHEIQRIAMRVENLDLDEDVQYSAQKMLMEFGVREKIDVEWEPYTDEDLKKILALFANLRELSIHKKATNITGSAFSAFRSSFRTLRLWHPNNESRQAAESLRSKGIEVTIYG